MWQYANLQNVQVLCKDSIICTYLILSGNMLLIAFIYLFGCVVPVQKHDFLEIYIRYMYILNRYTVMHKTWLTYKRCISITAFLLSWCKEMTLGQKTMFYQNNYTLKYEMFICKRYWERDQNIHCCIDRIYSG